jgi:hypothetical protein
MKVKLIAGVSAVVGAVAVVTLIAGVATAGIGSPTSPYPNVPINPKVCKAEAIKVAQAQIKYNRALSNYETELRLFNRGAASAYQLRTARKAVDESVIALDNAKYAQATCQNNEANPKDKDCVNLALELNRLLDELPVTQDLQAIATANYVMAEQLLSRHAISQAEFNMFKDAYEEAKLQTHLVEQQIADQKEKVTKAGCKNAVRPTPTPTKTTGSPSPSPSPSGSPTSTPTGSPSPSPSHSASPTSTPTGSPSPRPSTTTPVAS